VLLAGLPKIRFVAASKTAIGFSVFPSNEANIDGLKVSTIFTIFSSAGAITSGGADGGGTGAGGNDAGGTVAGGSCVDFAGAG